MAKKSSLFIRQSVIGLGFLSGIFTAIGIDPQDALIGIAGDAVSSLYPEPGVRYLFLVIPTLLLLISIYTAYRLGGILGLVSVVIAYFSGLAVFSSITSAIILLAVAVVLAYLATNRRLMKKLKV